MFFAGRAITTVLICIIVAGFSVTATDDIDDPVEHGIVNGPLGEKLDAYLTRLAPFGFSGALLAARGDEIIINKGYGFAIADAGVPNTSETVFSIGSITKQFTAAGIMKLEMEGKLNTNDPIDRYFDNVPDDKKGITLHHLLTHTAGVSGYTGGDYDVVERDEIVRNVLERPLLFSPGEEFRYSNLGYGMLAAIIETVSGRPYEKYLNDNLFVPAGMEWTGYRIPDWDKKTVAHWYRGGEDNGTPLEKPYPYWNLLGNGGILSTTTDMYRWIRALGESGVLSMEAKKKIFTPFLNDYGYGWDVLETHHGTLIAHDGGSMLGNAAQAKWYRDENIIWVLFCNRDGERMLFKNGIVDKVDAIVFGGEVELPPVAKNAAHGELETFGGRYELTTGGLLTVSRENGMLALTPTGTDAVNLLLTGDQSLLPLYNELGKRAETIIGGILAGDFEPLRKELKKKDALERFRKFLSLRVQTFKENNGEIERFEIVFTGAPWWGDEGFTASLVKVTGERGNWIFALLWEEKKVAGLVAGMDAEPPRFYFLTHDGETFMGYNIGLAKRTSIRFIRDKNGSVTGVEIPLPDGVVNARKIH